MSTGLALISQVSDATELPEEMVQSELIHLIKKAGFSPAHLTMNELRLVLADYLQDVLTEAKEDLALEA